jgi:hypothetical protein
MQNGGEGGIRTLGPPQEGQRFSRPPRSTAPAPLPLSGCNELACSALEHQENRSGFWSQVGPKRPINRLRRGGIRPSIEQMGVNSERDRRRAVAETLADRDYIDTRRDQCRRMRMPERVEHDPRQLAIADDVLKWTRPARPLVPVGSWMLVSTIVVSTRMRRPGATPLSCAICTILSWIGLIVAGPSAMPQRPIVLASGILAPPTRVKSRYPRWAGPPVPTLGRSSCGYA